jgi:hypothetical protein
MRGRPYGQSVGEVTFQVVNVAPSVTVMLVVALGASVPGGGSGLTRVAVIVLPVSVTVTFGIGLAAL